MDSMIYPTYKVVIATLKTISNHARKTSWIGLVYIAGPVCVVSNGVENIVH